MAQRGIGSPGRPETSELLPATAQNTLFSGNRQNVPSEMGNFGVGKADHRLGAASLAIAPLSLRNNLKQNALIFPPFLGHSKHGAITFSASGADGNVSSGASLEKTTFRSDPKLNNYSSTSLEITLDKKDESLLFHVRPSPFILAPNYAKTNAPSHFSSSSSLFESTFDNNFTLQAESSSDADPIKQQLATAQQLLQSFLSQRDLLDSKIAHQQRIVDELTRRLQNPSIAATSSTTSTTLIPTVDAPCIKNNSIRHSDTSETTLQNSHSEALPTNVIQSTAIKSPNLCYSMPEKASTNESANKSVCLNWNYHGGCSLTKTCPQLHQCAYCGSEDHQGSQCCDHFDSAAPEETEKDEMEQKTLELEPNAESISIDENILAPIKLVADMRTSQSPLVLLPASEVCMNWNAHRCRMGERCKRFHVCSQCNGPHTALECTGSPDDVPPPSVLAKLYDEQLPSTNRPAPPIFTNVATSSFSATSSNPSNNGYTEVCLNFNNGRCKTTKCRRSHHCSVCYDPTHPAIMCPDPSLTPRDLIEAGVEICINWNNGRCDETDLDETEKRPACIGRTCHRVHICSVCKSADHPAFKCTWDTDAPLHPTSRSHSSHGHMNSDETAEICMNWNVFRCRMTHERCKRIHACIICKSRDHRGSECPRATADSALTFPQLNDHEGHDSGQQTHVDEYDSVCLNWNMGRCRMKKCRRVHACAVCLSHDHDQRSCPARLHRSS